MTDPFYQHIGIWYSKEDKNKVRGIMYQLSTMCKGEGVMRFVNDYNNYFFHTLSSTVKAVQASDVSRGERFTTSFILNPKNISQDIIDTVILPCATYGEGSVFVLDSEKDLERQLKLRKLYKRGE